MHDDELQMTWWSVRAFDDTLSGLLNLK